MEKALEYQVKKSTWYENEFQEVRFGDIRLDERLKKIMNRFSNAPSSTIAEACSGSPAETKGAYHFFSHSDINSETILEAHRKATFERARQFNTLLAIQDTSILDFDSHKNTKELGPTVRSNKGVDSKKGLICHTALILSEEGTPLGIGYQRTWGRKEDELELVTKKSKKKDPSRPIEEKESMKWIDALMASVQANQSNQKMIFLGDRENDLWEFYEKAIQLKADFVIRAKKAHSTVSLTGNLIHELECASSSGTYELKVNRLKFALRHVT
jgi:hypothetical protein